MYMENKISIITAIHNQLEYNKLFFESLQKNTYYSYELIIINNNSDDGSAEFFDKNGVTVINNRENLSYSAAQNQGMKYVKTDFIAFFNNDIYLSKEWDRKLIDYLENYNLDVICPCGIENMESAAITKKYMRKWRYVNAFQRLRMRLNMSYSKNTLKQLIYMMYGNFDKFCEKRAKKYSHFLYSGFAGNAVIARKSVFNKIGLWNEAVTAPDWDLNLRLHKNQVEQGECIGMYTAGDVFVHHFIRATLRVQGKVEKKLKKENKKFTAWNNLKNVTELYGNDDLKYLKKPVASIIVNTNNAILLNKLFLCLLNQSEKKFEIVVAQNGNSSDIKQIINSFDDKFMFHIRNVCTEITETTTGNNLNKAVMLSSSQYLIFINGNSLLHQSFVKEHLEYQKVGVALTGKTVEFNDSLSERIPYEDIVEKCFEQVPFYRNGYLNQAKVSSNNFSQKDENFRSNFSLFKGNVFQVKGFDEHIITLNRAYSNFYLRLIKNNIPVMKISEKPIHYSYSLKTEQ